MNRLFFLFTVVIFFSYESYTQQSEEMFKRAKESYDKGNLEEADSLMSISIKYDGKKKDFLKYYNRGIIRQEMSKIDDAILDFNESILQNKNFYPTWENLSICYYYLDSLEKAFEKIESGLKIEPKQLEGYVLAANYLYKMDDYNLCVKFCDRGLIITKDLRLLSYKSISLSSLKKYKNSKNVLNEIKILNQNSKYFYDATIYYYYSTNSNEFCEFSIQYLSLFGKDRTPLFGKNECFKSILECNDNIR